MRHPRLASLVVLLALGAVAGCGGDDEAETRASPEPPVITAPLSTPQPGPTAPQAPPPPPPTPQTTQPDYENAPSPHPPPPRTDSPENDTPPPPGSPAERFEQECERNPAACG
jgi:hypothetical protein